MLTSFKSFVCLEDRKKQSPESERLKETYQRCYEHAISKDSTVPVDMKECPEIQYLNSLLTNELDKFNSREININIVY